MWVVVVVVVAAAAAVVVVVAVAAVDTHLAVPDPDLLHDGDLVHALLDVTDHQVVKDMDDTRTQGTQYTGYPLQRCQHHPLLK
jgi:hypothetical protein